MIMLVPSFINYSLYSEIGIHSFCKCSLFCLSSLWSIILKKKTAPFLKWRILIKQRVHLFLNIHQLSETTIILKKTSVVEETNSQCIIGGTGDYSKHTALFKRPIHKNAFREYFRSGLVAFKRNETFLYGSNKWITALINKFDLFSAYFTLPWKQYKPNITKEYQRIYFH